MVVSLSELDHFVETRHVSGLVLKTHPLPLRLNSFPSTPSAMRAGGW